ncbi:MAG TPA: hypothetical protein DCS93_01120 [Microscillaceae bacterium]|nr:hypothetical protein [Microscillaceae bacterium]
MTTKTITQILLIGLGMAAHCSYAQYIPKKQRKNSIKLYNIHLKKGEKVIVQRPALYCDTLIMEDESTLGVPHSFKYFTLYAKYCKIGNYCAIFSRGKNGKVGVTGKYKNVGDWENKIAEAGSNAPHLNLYLNIEALGNLTIDATGGNGAPAQILVSSDDQRASNIIERIPGVYGSGGNVTIYYNFSQAIDFQEASLRNPKNIKRKKSYKKPTIIVSNTIGKMNPRVVTNYYDFSDKKTKKIKGSLKQGGSAEFILLREKNKRKNGQLKFTRKGSRILPKEAKTQ